jgi:N-dimethylarginine dimethylaminohydrolase
MTPHKVLMCEPRYFEVNYSGNEYMKSNLNASDKSKALMQWKELKEIYARLGFEVLEVEPAEGQVDMVFTANQSLPLITSEGEKVVVLSKMRNEQRKKEVEHFKSLYIRMGYSVIELPGNIVSFESMGDAIVDYNREIIFGGYGPRTDKRVYEFIAKHVNYKIVMLELINPYLYHLDTCFSMLNADTVVIDKTGFTAEGLNAINEHFENVIEALAEENLKYFVCNCHCPDGKNVIVQKGSTDFRGKIEKAGFNIIETDTSEFIKSGGSVFCMKMMLF